MAVKTPKFEFTEPTINKAFGGEFIPTFEVMLAEKYIDSKLKKDGTKVIKNNYEHCKSKQVIANFNKYNSNYKSELNDILEYIE